eukprot:COSAG01_NODE_8736_length_2677_cov_10.844065_2_plen_175_part_00
MTGCCDVRGGRAVGAGAAAAAGAARAGAELSAEVCAMDFERGEHVCQGEIPPLQDPLAVLRRRRRRRTPSTGGGGDGDDVLPHGGTAAARQGGGTTGEAEAPVEAPVTAAAAQLKVAHTELGWHTRDPPPLSSYHHHAGPQGGGPAINRPTLGFTLELVEIEPESPLVTHQVRL